MACRRDGQAFAPPSSPFNRAEWEAGGGVPHYPTVLKEYAIRRLDANGMDERRYGPNPLDARVNIPLLVIEHKVIRFVIRLPPHR